MMITHPGLLSALGAKAGNNTRISVLSLRGVRRRHLRIGRDCTIECRFSFDRDDARISIGDRCYVGRSHIVSAASVTLEDDVIVSWGVTIVDHNSHAIEWQGRSQDVLNWQRGVKDWSGVVHAPVLLKARCWIGFNATILKGVTIGEEAVVGAGSVVTKDVPPRTVVGGNPAKPIRSL